MKDLIVSQIVGYFAMTVTIVAIGLLGQSVLESVTGQKMTFAQSFLIFFIGVCIGMIARSQTVTLYTKLIPQASHEPRKAKIQKAEDLLRSFWFIFLITVFCGVIAGGLIPLINWSIGR